MSSDQYLLEVIFKGQEAAGDEFSIVLYSDQAEVFRVQRMEPDRLVIALVTVDDVAITLDNRSILLSTLEVVPEGYPIPELLPEDDSRIG